MSLDISGTLEHWQIIVHRAVSSLDYGTVGIVVHNGRVVQIETSRKIRISDTPRPDHRRQTDDIERGPDRTLGGASNEEHRQ